MHDGWCDTVTDYFLKVKEQINSMWDEFGIGVVLKLPE